jgi:uncharacterized surface protein with fasciclin (FAS1) repeats
LWEFIGDDSDLTEFADVVEDAELVDLFDGSTPPAEALASVLPEPLPQPVMDLLNAEGITVLAPTNEAIDALSTWNDISGDEEARRHFILAHVLAGQLDEEEIFAVGQVSALSGDVLLVDPATQTINGAHLVVVDQLGTNGIAHTVDAVLVIPPVTPPTTEAPTTAAPAPSTAAPATPPPEEPAPPPPTPPATAPA